MKKEKTSDTYNKGFTLIELMVVIAILSILVLIAVPLYKGYDEKATKQVCDTNCLQFERMYHIYLITENKEDTAKILLMSLKIFYKNMRKTFVRLMGILCICMVQLDVFCILKMKLMKITMMRMMKAYLFCSGINVLMQILVGEKVIGKFYAREDNRGSVPFKKPLFGLT